MQERNNYSLPDCRKIAGVRQHDHAALALSHLHLDQPGCYQSKQRGGLKRQRHGASGL